MTYFTPLNAGSILRGMLTDKTLKRLNPKDTIEEVFEKIGGVDGMAAWAESNKGTFYTQLYGKIVSPQFGAGEGLKVVIELPWLTSRPGPVVIEGQATTVPELSSPQTVKPKRGRKK